MTMIKEMIRNVLVLILTAVHMALEFVHNMVYTWEKAVDRTIEKLKH